MSKVRMILLVFVFATVASGCTPIAPLSPEAAPTPGPEWAVFTTANSELPSGTVYDLVVDDQNVVWMGTNGGLAAYGADGWTVYTSKNSALPHSKVTALAFDDAGDLWVGTEDGLAKFDGEDWAVYTPENSGLPYKSVHELVFDDEDVLWIGLGCFHCPGSGGLARFDGETWQAFDTMNSDLPNDHVIGLAIDEQGTKWIGTTQSLATFDGKTWTDLHAAEASTALKSLEIPAIAFDPSGDVWVASGGDGIARFDGDDWIYYSAEETPLPSDHALDLLVDTEGVKWIGTDNGVARLDDDGWTIYDASNSALRTNWIWTIAEDGSGNIWVGTNAGGLAAYREGGVLLP